MEQTIDTVLAIDFETANGKRTSACSVGIALFDYCNDRLIEKRQQLIDPKDEFFYRNTLIHSITSDDVIDAPTFEEFFPELINMIERASIVVSHNASFDICVFTQCAEKAGVQYSPFDFCCTLALTKQVLPELENHKLETVVNALQIGDFSHHRADDDAEMCGLVFLRLAKKLKVCTKNDISANVGLRMGRAFAYGFDNCCAFGVSRIRGKVKSANDVTMKVNSKLFEGKNLVFTGVFCSMSRKEAERTATERGGTVLGSVTKKTDYLVYGVQDMRATKGKEKSSKQLRAELLITQGIPIEVISEKEYLGMLSVDNTSVETPRVIEYREVYYPEDVNKGSYHCSNYYSQTIDESFVEKMPGRVPIDEIIHQAGSDAAFEEGYIYYCEGEKCHLENKLERAIKLFDCARYIGYAYPELYRSYAKAYRKIGDCDAEIEILQEGISRGIEVDEFVERIGKTKLKKQKKVEKETIAAQKQERREYREAEKAKRDELWVHRKQCAISSLRLIMQKDEEGAAVAEYKSFADAAHQTGINVKCIRDAVSGKQKHAGGYCWEVKDISYTKEEP